MHGLWTPKQELVEKKHDVESSRQVPKASVKRSGYHHWDPLGKSVPFPSVSSIQKYNYTQFSNYPGILWSLSVIPGVGEAICGHRWKRRTIVLSSNYINWHIPDIIQLCMVGIKLMLHKCLLFRSGFFQVYHIIKIIRWCLLKLKIPGPTLGLLKQNEEGGVRGIYILNDFFRYLWYSSTSLKSTAIDLQ